MTCRGSGTASAARTSTGSRRLGSASTSAADPGADHRLEGAHHAWA